MSEEPTASFSDILEKDLANIIAKADTGQPLNARERAIIEAEAQKEKAAGKKALSSVVTKSPQPAKSEIRVGADGRVYYPETYAAYGEKYQRKESAIRGWVRLGKKNQDLPPLEDPKQLVIWWEKWMSQKVPSPIERLARSSPETAASEEFSLEAETVDGSEDIPESITLDMAAAGSAMDSLQRLRSASKLCYEQYQAALRKGDHTKAGTWRKDWLDAEEKQRHWEKDITNILVKRGELVNKTELLGLLTSLAGTLRRNFQAAMKIYGRDLAPTLTDDELLTFSERHLEACFARLREDEFSTALQTK